MIRVTIELVSAITHRTSEIGRMYIANDAGGTHDRGNYDVAVCRRGTDEIPAAIGGIGGNAARTGKVTDYPRLAYNVWRLITRACLAAFPEELRTKNRGVYASLSPEVIRGLELMRRHLDLGGHDWTQGTAMADVQAAREWLGAAQADGDPA